MPPTVAKVMMVAMAVAGAMHIWNGIRALAIHAGRVVTVAACTCTECPAYCRKKSHSNATCICFGRSFGSHTHSHWQTFTSYVCTNTNTHTSTRARMRESDEKLLGCSTNVSHKFAVRFKCDAMRYGADRRRPDKTYENLPVTHTHIHTQSTNQTHALTHLYLCVSRTQPPARKSSHRANTNTIFTPQWNRTPNHTHSQANSSSRPEIRCLRPDVCIHTHSHMNANTLANSIKHSGRPVPRFLLARQAHTWPSCDINMSSIFERPN